MSVVQPAAVDGDGIVVTESSEEDLAVLRYLLDLALQPIDSFEGFAHVEQILLAALRYQLNSLCWALSLAQATRTPAFTGYIADAQRAAIVKMTDKRVWGYWAYEQLIGYGRWNPDPIAHANVMYSGYLGVMIGLYETLNSDNTFHQTGALTLRWDRRRVYHYDFARLAEAIRRNMQERPSCPQYPCEPHLIFPICNTFALNTLRMHDRLHGTALMGDLDDRVRRSYDRDGWRRRDGRFVTGRTRWGMTFLPPAVANDAWMAYWLHASMPDIATATWSGIVERDLHELDGTITLSGGIEHKVDFGNYNLRSGGAPTYAMAMKAAREMGDEPIYAGLKSVVEKHYPLEYERGAARHHGMSNFANLLTAMARFGGDQVMRHLIDGRLPESHRRGPVLCHARYPDVLVARAYSDGQGLDLVLRPGSAVREATLKIARLTPGAPYAVTGAETRIMYADDHGHADVSVQLRGRTEVTITAVPSGPLVEP